MNFGRYFRRDNRGGARSRSGAASVRSVAYSSSPLLASKTPPWRSKFIVALVGLSFVVLLGRALYVQVLGSDFFKKQGEIRFARTIDLLASRGRILDRNGQILAVSVPAPSLWVLPKDFEADRAQRRQLARLLGMTPPELDNKLDNNPNFVWLRRQVEEQTAKDVMALGRIKPSYGELRANPRARSAVMRVAERTEVPA